MLKLVIVTNDCHQIMANDETKGKRDYLLVTVIEAKFSIAKSDLSFMKRREKKGDWGN